MCPHNAINVRSDIDEFNPFKKGLNSSIAPITGDY